MAAALVVLLVAAAVSVGVDHRRDGGPVLPSAARAAASVLGQQTTGAPGGAAPLAAAVADLVTGAGSDSFSASGEVASGPAPTPDDGGPNVPDEPPNVPEPPPVQVPTLPIPEPVKPLTHLAAPVGAQACQYLGVLPLAVALGGALGSVPLPVGLADLLPYMQPLYDACLVVGVPVTETRCQIDNRIDDGTDLPPVPVALGLTVGEVIEGVPVPTPMGVFIDEMEALERLVLGPPQPGEAPRFSDRLEAALQCSQITH